MVDIKRRQELNEALELMHFGFRKLIEKPDQLLAERGMHRMHHRLLYFIARNEGLCVSDLQATLMISKQALHRPLSTLIKKGLVQSEACTEDARMRKLSLTRNGKALEVRLSRMQRNQFRKAFEHSSPGAESGWREVMSTLIGADSTSGLPQD